MAQVNGISELTTVYAKPRSDPSRWRRRLVRSSRFFARRRESPIVGLASRSSITERYSAQIPFDVSSWISAEWLPLRIGHLHSGNKRFIRTHLHVEFRYTLIHPTPGFPGALRSTPGINFRAALLTRSVSAKTRADSTAARSLHIAQSPLLSAIGLRIEARTAGTLYLTRATSAASALPLDQQIRRLAVERGAGRARPPRTEGQLS